ncbi:MAG: DNA primase DnaG, partial [archaeon]|nr:DNA primase DnaG [archaeon]
RLSFEIDGIVDKPDIIGAIFWQSEGLLGDEMDLKELQKNGKLGRIEIDFTTAMGRTKGTVIVPSSMDMAETSILAAGIESVDKVGPCEAKFEIVDIEDTRTNKRDEIKNRAQEILKKMMDKSRPDTQMLSDELRENVRAARLVDFGPDKLPAGPDVQASNEIIIVEGRADVLNMLKNQITNVIGMNGSNISPTIVELCKNKEVTVFIDGDRGGLLNARKLAQMANVDFVAKAPDGKEVEELTRKEIIQSLKRKGTLEEMLGEKKPMVFERRGPPRIDDRRRDSRGPRRPIGSMGMRDNRPRDRGDRRGPPRRWNDEPPRDRIENREREPREHPEFREPREMQEPMEQRFGTREIARSEGGPRLEVYEQKILTTAEEQAFKPVLLELKGTMKARILDEKNAQIKEVEVKDLVAELGKSKKKPSAIIFDGVVTKRLVEAAEKAGAKYVIGARKGKIEQNKNVKATAL